MGAYQILISVCKIGSKSLRKIALQILFFFVQTSPLTREQLWEVGGPRIFIEHLDESSFQPKILSTLALWLDYDNGLIF